MQERTDRWNIRKQGFVIKILILHLNISITSISVLIKSQEIWDIIVCHHCSVSQKTWAISYRKCIIVGASCFNSCFCLTRYFHSRLVRFFFLDFTTSGQSFSPYLPYSCITYGMKYIIYNACGIVYRINKYTYWIYTCV